MRLLMLFASSYHFDALLECLIVRNSPPDLLIQMRSLRLGLINRAVIHSDFFDSWRKR